MSQATDPDATIAQPTGCERLRGRTILLVHIGSLKKEFIPKSMKQFGLRVVALHTHKEAWIEPYVDEWILVEKQSSDAKILEAVREYQRTHPEHPLEGAITFWEEEVPLLAAICKEFGFTGNSSDTAFLTRSKFEMQEMFRQKGCNGVRQHLVKSADDLEKAIEKVGFPSIMKPLYGSDSLFVVHMDKAERAREVYPYLCENYKQHPYEEMHKVECGDFVFQEYVDGMEFSIECYIQHGVPHVLCVHEKTKMQLPFFMETGDITPPRIPDADHDALVDETKKALIALGVRDSLAHVEIKLSSRGPQIIEIASRMGGDDIYHSVKSSTGIDMVKVGCEVALGVEVTDRVAEKPRTTYAKYFIPRVCGTITSLQGFEDIARQPDVVYLSVSKKVGDYVAVPPEGFESIGWVLVVGDSHAQVERRMQELFEMLSVNIRLPAQQSGAEISQGTLQSAA